MHVVVIDNYDSFTFNLVQALQVMKARVSVFRNDEIGVEDIAVIAPDRVVISPGPGRPERAGICLDLIRRLGGRVPILGVCLGHQAIATAFGGDVVRAIRPMHGKASRITHDGRGLFATSPSPLVAARYHSLVVEESSLGDRLEVTARSEEAEVMGLRLKGAPPGAPCEGVQFHPESFLTPAGGPMLAAFLENQILEVAE